MGGQVGGGSRQKGAGKQARRQAQAGPNERSELKKPYPLVDRNGQLPDPEIPMSELKKPHPLPDRNGEIPRPELKKAYPRWTETAKFWILKSELKKPHPLPDRNGEIPRSELKKAYFSWTETAKFWIPKSPGLSSNPEIPSSELKKPYPLVDGNERSELKKPDPLEDRNGQIPDPAIPRPSSKSPMRRWSVGSVGSQASFGSGRWVWSCRQGGPGTGKRQGSPCWAQ